MRNDIVCIMLSVSKLVMRDKGIDTYRHTMCYHRDNYQLISINNIIPEAPISLVGRDHLTNNACTEASVKTTIFTYLNACFSNSKHIVHATI